MHNFNNRRSVVWRILFWSFLVGFTIYMALDTFLITRVYRTAQAAQSSVTAETAGTAQTAVTTAADDTSLTVPDGAEVVGTYKDDSIDITVYSCRAHETTCYFADVKVSSPEYLKTALAKDSYGKNVTEKTSEIAADHGAVLAINGDYYGVQETGYVIRNGVLYRDEADEDRQDLVIYKDGSMEVTDEAGTSAAALLNNGAQQVLSFGPALVTDSEISVTQGEEVGRAMASNPRTAIGALSDTHYVFFVSDGRTEESIGLSLYQTAQLMKELGCTVAYNLDGGGSSTMVFDGKVINNPTTNGNRISERSVSDIVYIG